MYGRRCFLTVATERGLCFVMHPHESSTSVKVLVGNTLGMLMNNVVDNYGAKQQEPLQYLRMDLMIVRRYYPFLIDIANGYAQPKGWNG